MKKKRILIHVKDCRPRWENYIYQDSLAEIRIYCREYKQKEIYQRAINGLQTCI